jgi:hypothetical protein
MRQLLDVLHHAVKLPLRAGQTSWISLDLGRPCPTADRLWRGAPLRLAVIAAVGAVMMVLKRVATAYDSRVLVMRAHVIHVVGCPLR